MEEKIFELKIAESSVSSFLACIGLGVLSAVRDGALSPSAGIWTVGMPRFWEPFENLEGVSQEVLTVLSSADELSALKKLAPEAFDQSISELIARLEEELKKDPEVGWNLRWFLKNASKLADLY